MRQFELTPTDRKSFYGKCKVEEIGKSLTLFSYGQDVAAFDNGKLWVTKNEQHLTKTTLRHINAFLKYLGRPTITKKQILNQ